MAANTAEATPILQEWIPLRGKPDVGDDKDNQRSELVKKRFHSQDVAYIGFSKTVEEHVRMLSGRQWDVWSDVLGRFIDLLQYMSEDEKRWRQRPVMDYLGYWYQLTLSKATENPPTITFMPAGADRIDAMLADVMDPVWKTIYEEAEFDMRLIRAAAWCLVAGQCYIQTRVEFTDDDPEPVIGPAVLSLQRPDGSTIERSVDAVPYDEEGNPQAELQEDPEHPGEYGYDLKGEPYLSRPGEIAYDVLGPLEVRAQWGQQLPWTAKQWIIQRWFLTPAEVKRRWGVECQADHYPDVSDVAPGYLERLLFGSGYYGSARNDPNGMTTDTLTRQREGYVCGYTMWEKPDAAHSPANRAEGRAGGRLLIVTASDKVLWDSERPYDTEAAGPIRKCGFIEIPGRPLDSTPLEKMVPLQKRINRVEAQIAEHTNLVTNPVLLVHELAGIGDDEWVARPGTVIPHGFVGPGRPAEWLAPPPLSNDVWKHRDALIQQLFIIGGIQGNQSAPPTPTASGELVEQLRFNADRPLAPLTRSLARIMADCAEDTLAILPTIWTKEKLLHYAGDDNVVRTITVLPEMFEGRCRVRPQLESAAAESREKKQERLIGLYQIGAFGNIQDPVQQPLAVAKLLELLQFPDMSRAMRPGGVNRVTAEHNLGRLVRGEAAQSIALYEWYQFDVHLGVLENFMSAPEYTEQTTPDVQKECVLFREMLHGAQQQAIINAASRQVETQGKVGVLQAAAAGDVKKAAVSSGAQPPDRPPGTPGGPAGAGGENAPADANGPAGGPHSPSSPPRQDSRAVA